MLLLIGILVKYISYLDGKKKKPINADDIRTFHVFPDYIKTVPYECGAGEKLRFIVRGYTDKKEIKEVPIDGKEVLWKHTEGNGIFAKGFTGTYIDYITPELGSQKEKLIFVSAHYRNFTDATWIKVIK
jgi:hypothetical protein